MGRPILLDTNIALLFMVGVTNKRYIAYHERVQAFDAKDFEIICEIIEKASEIVFTSHVLTETSNLLRQIKNPRRDEISITLANIIKRTREIEILSRVAVDRAEYLRLGLTDAVLLEASRTGAVIFTADGALYAAAWDAKCDAINYNHLRAQRRDFQD